MKIGYIYYPDLFAAAFSGITLISRNSEHFIGNASQSKEQRRSLYETRIHLVFPDMIIYAEYLFNFQSSSLIFSADAEQICFSCSYSSA